MSNSFHIKDHSSAVPSAGPPMRVPDLAERIANADLILVATVIMVSDASGPASLLNAEAQPAYDQLREAELTVFRTIVGEPDNNLLRVFFLEGKVPSRPWKGLAQGQTVLLFLRSTKEGYVPVAPSESPIQTFPEIAPPPAGLSKTQAVAHELEQIILTADPISDASLIIQASMARVGLRGDVDLHLLGMSALQDLVRRAAWVAIALADGKVEALDEVPPLFADPAPPPAGILRNLIVQKVSEVRAPVARLQLGALLQSSRVELARAAAVALRQLHDPTAVPDLIGALDHADQQVRYQAVMGLAELEPSVVAGPSFELYRQNESYYIQRWKDWQQHRDNL